MRLLRILLKAPLFLILVLAYIFVSLFWRLWTQDIIRRRHHYTKTVSFFCRQALRMMHFKINVINPPPQDRPYLLVGNHLGILDILVLAAVHPTLFITSVEMRQTAGLGFLTEMGGCLYVDRRSRSQIPVEIEKIRTALKQGFSVVLYPEGTSSNGEQVLPFKKSLLVAAVGTDVPLLPTVINYRKVNGEPVSDKWRDYVCWYGDHTFLPFLFRILSVQMVEVDLEFAQEFQMTNEGQRHTIASDLHALISSKYTKIPAV